MNEPKVIYEGTADALIDSPGSFEDGIKAGMEIAARSCEDRAKRYRANGTTIGPLQASAADSCAFHIRKASGQRHRGHAGSNDVNSS